MTTKERLLQLFEENKGMYFSGEEIAAALQISRTAVWKAVNSLRSAGYAIDAGKNRGYCLSVQSDILSVQGIRKYLDPACQTMQLQILQETPSTNALLRRMAADGAEEGCTVIANSQSAGRGRRGRDFYSPEGSGIYMSILLRPRNWTAGQSVKLTTMAAVAMCRAMEAVSGETPRIKWVNDLFLHGKKICGILTEGAFDAESGMLEYAVLGLGINLYPPEGGFPPQLQDIAGTLFRQHQNDMKNRLTAAFLNQFRSLCADDSDYIEDYRRYSLVVGKQITVHSPEGDRTARALEIDDDCRLLVQYGSGQQQRLSYGEISVRL